MSDNGVKTKEIIQLLQQLLGTQQTVTIPRLLARVFGGLQEGAFIQQLFYWTSRTGDSEGWVHKTHEDWYSECFVSPYNISKVVNAYDFISVKRVKSPFYQYKSINIYRLDTEAFLTFLIEQVKAEKAEVEINQNDGLLISENEKFNIGKSKISDSIENEKFDILNINDYTMTINNSTADADGLSEDTEEVIQEADAEQPDTPSGNPFFDLPSEADWDSLKPAYEKAIPVVAQYYGLNETDGQVKVLACIFTKEARYVPRDSEWAKHTLTEAMTLEDIEAMLKDWKLNFADKMPSKPMTVQANVSKWINSRKGASGASGTESKLKPSAIPEDF